MRMMRQALVTCPPLGSVIFWSQSISSFNNILIYVFTKILLSVWFTAYFNCPTLTDWANTSNYEVGWIKLRLKSAQGQVWSWSWRIIGSTFQSSVVVRWNTLWKQMQIVEKQFQVHNKVTWHQNGVGYTTVAIYFMNSWIQWVHLLQ